MLWWTARSREGREKRALERSLGSDARERLRDVESAVARALEQVAATRENAQEALKLHRQVQNQGVEIVALRNHVAALQQALETGLQDAHATARQALNVTKGGKGRSREDAELVEFGRNVRELSDTPEGRQKLIQQLRDLDNVNGAARAGTGILGLA
jgi:hypothetical protein